MSKLPRWMHRVYAKTFGYFWLACPICKRMFGGHVGVELLELVERLHGERVTGTWSHMSVRLTLADNATVPSKNGEFAIMTEAEERIRIGGHEVNLGKSVRHLLAARVDEWEPDETGERGRLTLVPGTIGEFETWLPSSLSDDYSPVPGVSFRFQSLLKRFMADNDEALHRLAG